MRSINLSEEEIKTLKEFIAITVRTYGDASVSYTHLTLPTILRV